MNENTVSLHIRETDALALYALLGHGCSGSVIDDLGLGALYSAFADHFDAQDLGGTKGFITRQAPEIPVSVTCRESARHTIIELI